MFKFCLLLSLFCVAAHAAILPVVNDGCPAIRPGEMGICAFMCGGAVSSLQRRFLDDGSCPAGKICCPTACGGTSCVTPVIKRNVPSKKCTQIMCFVDPCMVATCAAHPDARCVSNYCGGCSAHFYVGDARVVC